MSETTLLDGSERERHDVRVRAGLRIRYDHPQAGMVTLECEKLAVPTSVATTVAGPARTGAGVPAS